MEKSILDKMFELYFEGNSEEPVPDPEGYCKQFFKLTDKFKSALNDTLRTEFEEILNVIFARNSKEQSLYFKRGFKVGFYLANELKCLE